MPFCLLSVLSIQASTALKIIINNIIYTFFFSSFFLKIKYLITFSILIKYFFVHLRSNYGNPQKIRSLKSLISIYIQFIQFYYYRGLLQNKCCNGALLVKCRRSALSKTLDVASDLKRIPIITLSTGGSQSKPRYIVFFIQHRHKLRMVSCFKTICFHFREISFFFFRNVIKQLCW